MCLADWVFLGALVVIIGLPCTYYSGTTAETMNKQSTPVTNLIDIFLSILKLTKFHRVLRRNIQGGWGGWPKGNGKKLSSCQAQLGQATCLAVA